MAVTKVIEFDAVSIKNASIQVFENNVAGAGTSFGCVGSIEGETEVKELVKICEGVEAKKVVIPLKMNLSVSAHIPVDVARDIFGLSNEGLKAGVFAYGPESLGKRFIFTADVVDEFEDVVKLIAFPNSSNASGFQIKVENGQDEVALLEMEFTALVDPNNKFYYEAMVTEIEEADVAIATSWHTAFTTELVKSLLP
ncbi:phage tail protein [Sporosarcina sp. E16_8]|uniref:phage tail protein n=1 Tax=Sporosarcina sp. E16_8 TaxID=2789295 RepID=UPI001A91D68F|nr:phage tail protein [Sporosarcina sp. E16_8]MBO0586457.1 phage tail protein [Sporosarcina sp. E16_8]